MGKKVGKYRFIIIQTCYRRTTGSTAQYASLRSEIAHTMELDIQLFQYKYSVQQFLLVTSVLGT